MKGCPLCGCEGRIGMVAEEAGGPVAHMVCGNQSCGNYKRAFAQEALGGEENRNEEETKDEQG